MTAPTTVSRRRTDPASRLHAAGIWAAATAARDDDPDPASAPEALPIIDSALEDPGSFLLLAQLDDDPVGFALLQRRDAALVVQYLAVDPCAWGNGVATVLLVAVDREAGRERATRLELWVYEDNDRAVSLYRRAGWQASDDVRRHPISQRRERRYTKPVPSVGGVLV